MTASERDLLGFHLIFGTVATATLLLRPDGEVGPYLVALVLAYHLGSAGISLLRGHGRWFTTWRFGAILSVFMVLPDAFLAAGLGVLEFVPDGVPDLGPVTLPMAGMWAIPAVLIVSAADAVAHRRGDRAGWLAAAATAGVVFAGAEATLTRIPVWRAVDVTTVGEVALYIVPAELFLGVAIVAGTRWCRRSRWTASVPVAALVAVAYTGAAALSWLVIEAGMAP
jgi:hypothetical protein